jgi:hypothetical protein
MENFTFEINIATIAVFFNFKQVPIQASYSFLLTIITSLNSHYMELVNLLYPHLIVPGCPYRIVRFLLAFGLLPSPPQVIKSGDLYLEIVEQNH